MIPVKVFPGRALTANEAPTFLDKTISAINYITDLKVRHGLNIVAINASWHGPYSAAQRQAIASAGQQNILVVAAAGNSNMDNDSIGASYPASYDLDNIISVAAIDQNGDKAAFSNYGWLSVDLAAPGVGIMSTIPNDAGISSYMTMSGTSMAAPHVTGAVAMYAARHPGTPYLQIKNAILNSVYGTPFQTGRSVTGGRLNIDRAMWY